MDRKYFDLSWTKKLDQAMKDRIREFFTLAEASGFKALLCEDEEHYELYGLDDEFVSRRPIGILTI
ncbi:hypothetical protein IT407_05050 [Candidatus Uhrbacteria bacterium]|nr:hypothetical protein [Candidatus Uhrbacteria bacterium]